MLLSPGTSPATKRAWLNNNLDMRKIYHYKSFEDDVAVNPGQNHKMPDGYRIIRDRPGERIFSAVLYAVFDVIGKIYLKFWLHARFVGRDKLLGVPKEKGYFIYANHTQEFGDPMIALQVGRGKVRRRDRAIAAPSNFGLPVLGPLLPYLGAIPTAEDKEGISKLQDAVSWCCSHGQPVVIFPEAHVWPWYTGVRPFSATSFHFPVRENAPCFAMTVTYQKRRHGHRPRTRIFIDGPFYPDESLPSKKRKEKLRDAVHDAMEKESKHSDYSYAEYVRDE